MNFTDKFIRRQLELTKPLIDSSGLELSRSVQDKIGRLMRFSRRGESVMQDFSKNGLKMSLLVPRDELRRGLLLYLHGGGYTAGGIDYSRGFASVLASELGMRVLCFEYRLAPEHPYPAALLDCVDAYKAALEMGYTSDSIVLVGESAGGGLCYALSLKLEELGMERAAGIVAISPWCDLTLSGESYETNKDADPSLTYERLEFFANAYVGALSFSDDKKQKKKPSHAIVSKREEEKKNPYISPIFGKLSNMPRSLILVGGDEILLSDSVKMAERLREEGADSKLIVKNKMWHAYLLYGLKSQSGDFDVINNFLKSVLPRDSQRKLRWMHLDNAAKIYPAAATSRWTNVFRLSASLTEDINIEILQAALDVTVRRFPSIAVRLRRGTFWYYLEEIEHAPSVMYEKSYPLTRMPFDDIRSCAFRVIVYKRRIAIEFFHALTDGNGGLIFLKTLLAEYLSERYSISIPVGNGVFDRLETPNAEELVDNFPSVAGEFPKSRRDTDSYRILGEREYDGFLNVTSFILRTDELLAAARREGVSLTAYLAAALIKAAIYLQREDVVHKKNEKPIKILLPCDLRRIYEGKDKTLRNFVLYVTPGIDPRLGEYTHSEICKIVAHKMALEINPKNISSMVKTNVKDEENLFLKLMPLFIKNIAMKLVFNLVGERKSTLTLSNLGLVRLPEIMDEYVERFDFTLGVQAHAPYNSGLISYKDKSYLNIIRNIREPRLEMALYRVLRELGIKVKLESNQR